jgi:hypothetical protein
MSLKANNNHTSYEIGYGRPPLHSRFKRGQSGNPAGRRRNTESERGRQLLRQEANRLVTLREGDKVVRVTALQATVRSLFYAAAKGNPSAQRMVLNAIQDLDLAELEANPPSITVRFVEPGERNRGDILEGLDLTHLSDEQLDQLDTLLSLALKKKPDTTQSPYEPP